MKKYALLFAGCVNENNMAHRYNNDLGFINEVLTKYNYDKIIILYTDGRNISYNGSSINTLCASKQVFLGIIDQFKQELGKDDHLVVAVSNHGNLVNGVANINCWGSDSISEYEFALALNKLEAKKIVLLGQCYGGNLIRHNIANSILISANSINKVSYSTKDRQYDEFLYQFISFYNSTYPDGKPLNSFSLDNSIIQAFNYSKENNSYKVPINLPTKDGLIIIHEVPELISYNINPKETCL